jgi:hypothetical protein
MIFLGISLIKNPDFMGINIIGCPIDVFSMKLAALV